MKTRTRRHRETYTIREATEADIPTILRFTLSLAEAMGTEVNQKVLRDGVTQFIRERRYGRYFLASATGHVIGQIVIKPVVFEPWKKSRIVWVDDFYMTPDYSRTEAMKRLLSHGITWAVTHEHEQIVRLFCPHNHPDMLRGLLSLGFAPIGIMMQQRQDYFFNDAPTCTIREATSADISTIMKFTLGLASVMQEQVNQKILRDGLMRFLREGHHGKYFLAIVGRKIAGQIVIKPAIMEPWKNSRIAWVDDVFVDTPFRERGIAKQLLHHGTQWAVAGEHEQIVRLFCSFTNDEALMAWLSLGFVPIGYMMQQRQDYLP